ncbi:MAG: hypothetical protein ACKV2Q_14445 [Planctomycetaceae bacterium]
MKVNFLAKREHVHSTSVWRWINHGVHGVRLRAVRIGGRRWILESDWQAFCDALNSDQAEPLATTTARADRAGTELDRRLGGDGSHRRRSANA